MPVSVLDRVPLPNLREYTAFSIVLLSATVYHAINVTSDPNWKSKYVTAEANDDEKNDYPRDLINIIFGNATQNSDKPEIDVVSYMLQEPICVWTLINMTYCCLMIIGSIIQHAVFGELRVSERQQLKDKFWNFVFYKFIFVFGVISVQYMDEVVLWVAWFTALGSLNLLTQLCKDRFEYLSFSATSGGWAGARLAMLLGAILVVDGLLMMLCVGIGVLGGGLNTFAFMCAECVLLSVRATHVLFRYTMHIMEARGAVTVQESLRPLIQLAESEDEEDEQSDEEINHQEQPSSETAGPTSDRKAPLSHYAELGFELLALTIDLAHHIHMLLWSNIFLSMASLVICMQLRYLFQEIQRKVKKHRNYVWVISHMEKNYPMATAEELNLNSDNCAICWEKMESARKLPCNHLFHTSCLSSWLQQDTSCPTCRMVLSLWPTRSPSADVAMQLRQPDHFFHFDGSRYVSWLPSFSVEVTHRMSPEPLATTSQIDAMARQVQQLFPHFPLSYLGRDLMVTHSVEVTVDNILDGRLTLPQRLIAVDDDVDAVQNDGTNNTPLAPPPSLFSGAPSQALLHQSLSMLASHLASQRQQIVPEPTTRPTVDSDIPSTSSNSDANTPLEVQFSKSPVEREKLLQTKKNQLILAAKKKYLEKLSSTNNQQVTSISETYERIQASDDETKSADHSNQSHLGKSASSLSPHIDNNPVPSTSSSSTNLNT